MIANLKTVSIEKSIILALFFYSFPFRLPPRKKAKKRSPKTTARSG
jgi:hypothetical protein